LSADGVKVLVGVLPGATDGSVSGSVPLSAKLNEDVFGRDSLGIQEDQKAVLWPFLLESYRWSAGTMEKVAIRFRIHKRLFIPSRVKLPFRPDTIGIELVSAGLLGRD
jgi:hypothetical protein